MNIKRFTLKFAHTFSLSLVILASSNTFAAPGELSSTPLIVANAVKPNVFFTLDDSGSMTFEAMVPEISGILTNNGVYYQNYRYRAYWHPGWSDYYIHNSNDDNRFDRNIIPPAQISNAASDGTTASDLWVMHNHNINTLYYNPSITYTPWVGTDSNGDPYPNADPGATLRNPNDPTGDTVNLEVKHVYYDNISGDGDTDIWLPSYYTATDSNGNGEIDVGDDHTLVEIAAGTTEMDNFANWFQYYRTREFATKAAIGNVINNANDVRMGLDLFNDGHQESPKDMSTSANKTALMNTFYSSISSGGTPARTAMKRVGNNFATSSAFIQPQADGGECQQNFNVFMTDGYWNGRTSPAVGNTDKDTSGITDNGFDGDPNESVDDGNYEDDYEDTLADVAMHYYETDLSGLADKVPTLEGTDEADHQHLVTYAVSFGVNGTLDPSIEPTDATFAGWPDPDDGDPEKIDDLRHAAYNGRGAYLNARNHAELQSALDNTIQNISDRTATAAAVAVNSSQLTLSSVVYVAQFNSDGWSGDLLAYLIEDTTFGTLASETKWGGMGANEILTNRNLSLAPRNIITYNGTTGVPFEWSTANLSAEMLSDLRTDVDDTTAEARLNYLRGDRSNEGSLFRSRASLLGDIVNSGPVFVGQADLSWPDIAPFPEGGNKYSDFKNGLSSTRDKVVYAGSNDGMIHAFDDDTGAERFAYVPNLIASSDTSAGYHYLTDPNYLHNWYVDLTPTVSDVYLPTGGGWQTILVGGLRGGGRGLFALDITNPANFSESNAAQMVLWEFSSADDIDLGYTYSRPTIALANNGRWVAIFGNGYNDLGSGEAKLFILDIELGKDGWIAGDYRKITTGVGGVGGVDGNGDPVPERNGLSSPALADVDGNGTVDRVYAGDLEGNMWAFDLSDTDSAQWDVAYSSSGTPEPLYKPDPSATDKQPVTAKPILAKHPTIPLSSSPPNAPNLMVYFGTGQYLVDADQTDNSVQSYYGVWDKGDSSRDRATHLIQQTISAVGTNRAITTEFVDYSEKYGWWFNLSDPGERSVTNSIARADTVFFNSFVPVDDPCSVGGYGYKFAIDMATGGSPLEPVIDTNNDGSVNDDDRQDGSVIAAIRQDGYLPEPVFIEDLVFTGRTPLRARSLPDIPTGRFSWQELIK